MKELFEQFLQENKYLANCSRNTIIFYELSYKAYKRVLSVDPTPEDQLELGANVFPEVPTKHTLTNFVIKLREGGMSTGAISMFAGDSSD